MSAAAELGLYLHLPFCPARCPYCDFFAQRFSPGQASLLIQAIRRHIPLLAESSEGRRLDSLFIGGGTPSMLPAGVIADFVELIDAHIGLAANAEVTIEANPGTLSLLKLRLLRLAGINRLSIGAQSFDEETLQRIGRRHSPAEIVRSVHHAREGGFDNINLDLIYGLPDQNAAQAMDSLEQALELEPDHLSLYELTLSPHTPFGRRLKQGQAPLPSTDEILDLEDILLDRLEASPLRRYEVSNFALPGHECRHNQNTWRGGDYLALGPGAHGHIAGVRWSFMADVAQYADSIAMGHEPVEFREELSPEQRALELIMLGLRTVRGVDMTQAGFVLSRDPVAHYGAAMHEAQRQGWASLHGGRLLPTKLGLRMADAAAALFT